MKLKFILPVFVFLVLAVAFVSADVGVGVSPARMVEQVEAGQEKQIELLIFNTGDSPLEISISFSGDIAQFAKVITEPQLVKPEPKPQKLPIKNGKIYLVNIDVPSGTDPGTYSGLISATGGAVEGSTFGGNVGVSTKIDIKVVESESFFSKISMVEYVIFGVVVLLIFLVWFLKKQGLSISFKKNSK